MRLEPHALRSVQRAVALAWRQGSCRSSSNIVATSSCSDMTHDMAQLAEPKRGDVSWHQVPRWWWEGTRDMSQRAVMSLVTERILESSILRMAAPKKKTSPSRKGMRSSSKYIRFVPVVSQCSKCSRIFPPHAMPSKCEEQECPAFPHAQSREDKEES